MLTEVVKLSNNARWPPSPPNLAQFSSVKRLNDTGSLDTPTNLVYKNIHKKLRVGSRRSGMKAISSVRRWTRRSSSSSPSTSSWSRIIMEAGCMIRLGGGVVGAASNQVIVSVSLRPQRLVERPNCGWEGGCAGVHVWAGALVGVSRGDDAVGCCVG